MVIELKGRINSSNAKDVEEEILKKIGDNKDITLDAEKLEYISSAGLRILLKIRKSIGKLEIVNVSSDVYEIFEVTGFTDILDVKKALRFVSTKNCTMIGHGGHGKVYRLEDDMIIKVYRDDISLEAIDLERRYAKNAFINGIPSAIAFDVVRCEDGYGLIFEMAGATTLSKFIENNPDKLAEYTIKYTELLRTLNETKGDKELYGNIKDIYMERINKAKDDYTEEETEKLHKLLNSIPDTDGMVHGDYHPNNVMVQEDGELILIDMADISIGNELFDMGGACLLMFMTGQNNHELTKQAIGIEFEKAVEMWNIMLSTYYKTTDAQKLRILMGRCVAFGFLRMATTLGMNSEIANEIKVPILDSLRKNLFPKVEEFCKLFAMPISF